MRSREEAVASAFRKCFLWDATMTRPGQVADYQAMFPGHEKLIASEYERISSSAQSGGADEKEPKAVERRFGPYRIERVLGRGGQGTVYSAIDARDGRNVALKVFRADGTNRQRRLQRLRREASATANLDHPGICRFREAGLHEGVPYLAMHLVPGTSLAHRIAHAPRAHPEALGTVEASAHLGLPGDDSGVARCVRLFEQVARAIHAAHEAGLIHRDLKPGNLMVTPAGEPVILDFGLVRDEEEGATITLTGAVLGTIAYMAPEQIAEGGPRLDRRVDVYALGVSLFEALTFLHPFQAATREAALRASQAGELKDLRDLDDRFPEDLALVVATAMRRDRDRRYETALALAEDLEAFRLGKRVRAKPLTAVQRLGDWAARHPALAASTAVAFVTLGAGLAVSLNLLGSTRDALAAVTKNRNESNEVVGFLTTDVETALLEAGKLELAEKIALRAKTLFESVPKEELSESEREILGDVYAGLGLIYEQEPGGRPKANAAWDLAYEIRERLHEEHPDVPRYTWNFAIAVGERARRGGTPPAEAMPRCARAVALIESLPPPLRDNTKVRWERLYAVSRLGDLQRRMGRLADAHRTLETAASVGEEMLRANPDDTETLSSAVKAQLFLVGALEDLGRGAEAQARLDATMELVRKKLEEQEKDPPRTEETTEPVRKKLAEQKDPHLVSLLGDVLLVASDMARARGAWDSAVAAADEMRAISVRLRDQEPMNVGWRYKVSSALDRLALALLGAGKFDEALAASKPAREIAAVAATMPVSQVDGRGQRELGQVYRTYGAVLGRTGATDAALAELDESTRWLDRSQATVPEDVMTPLVTMSCLQERANTFVTAAGLPKDAALRRAAADPADDAAVADWAGRALSCLDRADVVARSLLAEHPDYARAARDRALVLRDTAAVRVLLGDTAGAAGALEEAIRIRDGLAGADPGYVTRLRDLDEQLAQTRRPADAR